MITKSDSEQLMRILSDFQGFPDYVKGYFIGYGEAMADQKAPPTDQSRTADGKQARA